MRITFISSFAFEDIPSLVMRQQSHCRHFHPVIFTYTLCQSLTFVQLSTLGWIFWSLREMIQIERMGGLLGTCGCTKRAVENPIDS